MRISDWSSDVCSSDLLGSATIKSITAYRKSRVGTTLDLDGLPINMVSFKSDYAQHQFSEELQVYGSAGDLDWIAGAYYFIEKGTERSDAKSFGFLNPAAPVARTTDRTSTRLNSSHECA